MKLLLSIKEASELCGLDDKRISDEIKNGSIKVFRLPGMAHPKIPLEELHNWINKNTYQINKEVVYDNSILSWINPGNANNRHSQRSKAG